MPLLGYFITFHTYGTWFHGDEKGSVDKENNTPGEPLIEPNDSRESKEQNAMKHAPCYLNAEARFVVDATIREVSTFRKWTLHALNVRTTHVHVDVSGDHAPERMMNDFKAYATRGLRESKTLDSQARAWATHGSTRYLNDETSALGAVDYVMNQQGPPLPMTKPPGWSR